MTHERDELHRRIETRVDEMLENGWMQEATKLHGMNLPDHAPAKKALGYRELFRVIQGELTMEQAREKIKTATRQYAKRQMTWFRSQREVVMLKTPTPKEVESALGLNHE
ncbi:MAG: hypothetical protein JJU11_14030 [Candidatus Sumerlaeia bacterium]|nr:hypothetical protein [Candidatus Sumerlaeia bacterium]